MAAGGGCCWSGGGPGAPDGPSSSPNDSERSEQVPPGPCSDAFLHPGGRAACSLHKLQACTPCAGIKSVSRPSVVPVLHPAKVFQPCCPRSLATPLPHPVSSDHDRTRSRSLKFYWLSQAGPAGRLTPCRTSTALCASSRPARARRAPVRSTLCAATSLVTAAWRKGEAGHVTSAPPAPKGPGGLRVDCWYRAITASRRRGGCAAAVLRHCGLGSRRGRARSLR